MATSKICLRIAENCLEDCRVGVSMVGLPSSVEKQNESDSPTGSAIGKGFGKLLISLINLYIFVLWCPLYFLISVLCVQAGEQRQCNPSTSPGNHGGNRISWQDAPNPEAKLWKTRILRPEPSETKAWPQFSSFLMFTSICFMFYHLVHLIIEGSLEVKLPTIWTDEK